MQTSSRYHIMVRKQTNHAGGSRHHGGEADKHHSGEADIISW